MKALLFLFRALFCLLLLVFSAPAADPPFTSGQRVGFVGDSITDAKKWTAYVTAYLHLRYPDRDLHIASYGRGGTSTTSFLDGSTTAYEEWNKTIYGLGLNHAIIMLGHNSETSADSYQTNLTALAQDYAQAQSVTPILVGPWPQSNGTGSTTLQARSARVPTVGTALSVTAWDTWSSLSPVWTNASNYTALQRPGTQNTPATHAGTTGHALMGYYFIQAMGWPGSIFSLNLTSGGTVTSSSGASVTSSSTNAYSGIDLTFLPSALPWAYDQDGGLTLSEATAMVPEFATWQTCTLQITGLSSGDYRIYATEAGGTLEQIAMVTHTALGTGINLATLATGPLRTRPQLVLDAVRAQLGFSATLTKLSPNAGMERYVSNASNEYTNNGLRGTALRAALADEVATLDALDATIWSIAAPRSLQFSIRKDGVSPETPNTRTRRIRRALQ